MRNNRVVYEVLFERSLRGDVNKSPMLQLRDLLKHCYMKADTPDVETIAGKKIYRYRLHRHRLHGLTLLKRIREAKPVEWLEGDDLGR
jgi:hypothetical protein